MADRFYIGQVNGQGTMQNLEPFAIPDEAFELLQDTYLWRGRVRKRTGSVPMQATNATASSNNLVSRFKIQLGTADLNGDFSGSIPAGISGAIGQSFQVGDPTHITPAVTLFTVYQANGSMLATASFTAATGTFNTGTGAVVITNAFPGYPVYFIPSLPVMGFGYYEGAGSLVPTIGFDTRYAYGYDDVNVGWYRLSAEATGGAATWTGTNIDYFWSANYRGVASSDILLFVTNNTLADGMRYWNGVQWATFAPSFNSNGDFIVTAKIIIQFKDRLLLLNTYESVSSVVRHYPNRVRYCSAVTGPFSDNWYDGQLTGDPKNRGGFINAATNEAIISAMFLKDRLIVYCERSTWELVWTGNQFDPFVWQKINTELGVESTFSIVPFDRVVIGVGNVGIHACNGTNVERIDQKIPNEVFDFHNLQNAPERICGIRDYYAENVYWSYPSRDRSVAFPFNNQVLIYNYPTQSWGFMQDSITAFGNFLYTNDAPVSIYGNAGSPIIVGGNQQGFTFTFNIDTFTIAPSLLITNMSYVDPVLTITCINHNLSQAVNALGSYIKITNADGVTGLNNTIFSVASIIDENTFTIEAPDFSGAYTGGGLINLIPNPRVLSKQYNFYAEEGANCAVNKIDFLVSNAFTPSSDVETGSQTTMNYYASSSPVTLNEDGSVNGSLLGTSILDTSAYPLVTLEQTQSRLWHSMYPMMNGEYTQIELILSDEQRKDPRSSEVNFELHAMIFYAEPTSRLE